MYPTPLYVFCIVLHSFNVAFDYCFQIKKTELVWIKTCFAGDINKKNSLKIISKHEVYKKHGFRDNN